MIDEIRKDLKNVEKRKARTLEVEKQNLQEKYDRLQQEYKNQEAELKSITEELQAIQAENRKLLHMVEPELEAEGSTGQEQLDLRLTTEAVQNDSQGLPGEMV